jgi:hypothetical protein
MGTTSRAVLTLRESNDPERLAMSFTERREAIGTSVSRLHTWPRQYGVALLTVAVATLLRYPVGGLIGQNLPFVLFYPAILVVAWMAGPPRKSGSSPGSQPPKAGTCPPPPS